MYRKLLKIGMARCERMVWLSLERVFELRTTGGGRGGEWGVLNMK